MMMQMLEAGGIPILRDAVRGADGDNPKGYYELEKVKSLDKDASWIGDAEDRALKVVSMLLYELPGDRRYKVIFMTRSMDAVLASQSRMLSNRGEERGPDDAGMRKHFETHLAKVRRWLAEQDNIEVVYCSYESVLADPRTAAAELAASLGGNLDVSAMSAAVDPTMQNAERGMRSAELGDFNFRG
jgi:hypothetical protein